MFSKEETRSAKKFAEMGMEFWERELREIYEGTTPSGTEWERKAEESARGIIESLEKIANGTWVGIDVTERVRREANEVEKYGKGKSGRGESSNPQG